MPTLAGVVRGGGHVPLEDTQAVFTAASWATLVRGVPPPMHHLVADRVLVRGRTGSSMWAARTRARRRSGGTSARPGGE